MCDILKHTTMKTGDKNMKKIHRTLSLFTVAAMCTALLCSCGKVPDSSQTDSSSKPCSDAAQEKACEYCGYTYVVDTCTECPHCGAPIPPEDQPGHDLLDKKVTA